MLKSVGTTQESIFNQLYPVCIDEPNIMVCPRCGEHIATDDLSSSCDCGYGALPVVKASHTASGGKGKKRKRSSMSREGKEVSEMTEDELQALNDKWVYWMEKLEHTIRWYARRDEDLTQVGIISLRRTLCEDIDAPPNHLLHRAKMAIWMAYSYGKSVDSVKSDQINARCRDGGIALVYTDSFDHPYDNPLLADHLSYPPDVLAIDKVAYEQFRESLTEGEAKLLDLMIETQNDGKKGPPGHKKAFIRETGSTYSNYESASMSLLQQYYHHYGTKEQQAAFEAFYANWRPRTPMWNGCKDKAIPPAQALTDDDIGETCSCGRGTIINSDVQVCAKCFLKFNPENLNEEEWIWMEPPDGEGQHQQQQQRAAD